MGTKSIKEKRVFFTYKEATPDTPETTARFEGFGLFTPPKIEPLSEDNKAKTGSGQYGTTSELQAIWASWSYVTERVSEVAYFCSMGTGKSYTASGTDPYTHEIYGQQASGRTLPTFTIEYGNGTSNEVLSHCVINEISITGSKEGNGVVKATITGFGNSHKWAGNVLTLHTAGTLAAASEDYSAEPLLNFRGFDYWIGASADDVDASDVVIGATNLVSETDIGDIINSWTVAWSNGLTGEDLARGGGHGVLNLAERKDPTPTLEISLNKDTALVDAQALLLADTVRAAEFHYTGNYVTGSDPHAFIIIFPKIQIEDVTRGEETPIPETIPVKVLGDANDDAIEMYVQSGIAKEYNDTLA